MTVPEPRIEPEASDLGRFEPTPYDLGVSDDPEVTWAEIRRDDPEAGLGHDYDGPELRSGTPEYEALYAEYQAWASPAAEPRSALPPVVPDAMADWAYGREPGTSARLAAELMASEREPEAQAEHGRTCGCSEYRTDARCPDWFRAKAELEPDQIVFGPCDQPVPYTLTPEAVAALDDWGAEWDSADSNTYQARAEAGLEPEAEL